MFVCDCGIQIGIDSLFTLSSSFQYNYSGLTLNVQHNLYTMDKSQPFEHKNLEVLYIENNTSVHLQPYPFYYCCSACYICGL